MTLEFFDAIISTFSSIYFIDISFFSSFFLKYSEILRKS